MAASVWENPALNDLLEKNWKVYGGEDLNILQRLAGPMSESLDRSPHYETVLDVGCGPGRLHAKRLALEYRGVDGSKDMVRRCNERGIPATHGSAYRIPFPDASNDLVVCNAVLFHLTDWNPVVAELWRVTRKRLIFSTYWSRGIWGTEFGHRRMVYAQDDQETGEQFMVHNHYVPRWMIERYVRRKMRPARWGVEYYKRVGLENGPIAYVWADKNLG